MSAYNPASEAETRVLTALRNEDYKAWERHIETAGITPAATSREFAAAVYEAILLRALGNLAFDPGEGAELERVRLTFGLAEEEATEIRQKRGRKAVKALVKHLNIDGIITPAERAELEALGAEVALAKEDVAGIIEEVTGGREASQ